MLLCQLLGNYKLKPRKCNNFLSNFQFSSDITSIIKFFVINDYFCKDLMGKLIHPEYTDRWTVHGHDIIPYKPSYHLAKISSLFGDGVMHRAPCFQTLF